MNTKKLHHIAFLAIAAFIGSTNAAILVTTSQIDQNDPAPVVSNTDLGQTAALSYSATGQIEFLGTFYVARPGEVNQPFSMARLGTLTVMPTTRERLSLTRQPTRMAAHSPSILTFPRIRLGMTLRRSSPSLVGMSLEADARIKDTTLISRLWTIPPQSFPVAKHGLPDPFLIIGRQ